LIEKTPIVGKAARGDRTLGFDERLLTETESEIFETEESIPIKDKFHSWWFFSIRAIIVRNRNFFFLLVV